MAQPPRTTTLSSLQFIVVLAIGGALLMGVREIDPWIIDRVAVYVGLSYMGMALIAAVIGLMKA